MRLKNISPALVGSLTLRASTSIVLLVPARRANLNPYEYLREVHWRIGEHPMNRTDDLLADRIAAQRSGR